MNAGAFLKLSSTISPSSVKALTPLTKVMELQPEGSLTPRLDIALHVRNYELNFLQLCIQNAFSEKHHAAKRVRFVLGWKYRWSKVQCLRAIPICSGFHGWRFRLCSIRRPWMAYCDSVINRLKNILIFIQAGGIKKWECKLPACEHIRNGNRNKTQLLGKFRLPCFRQNKNENAGAVQHILVPVIHFTKGMIILQDVRWNLASWP